MFLTTDIFLIMKTNTLNNLQKGNPVTQRNAFLIIAAILVIAAVTLNHFGLINLSALNKY